MIRLPAPPPPGFALELCAGVGLGKQGDQQATIGFVECRDEVHQSAEPLCDRLAIAREQLRRVVHFEPAACGEPQRSREMAQCYDRPQPARAAGF